MQGLLVAGHLAMAWSLGLVMNLVFLDLGPGFARDHPPRSRQRAGLAAGFMAVASLLLQAWVNPLWVTGLIVAPFALITLTYSFAWLRRWRHDRRRTIGRDAAIIGGIALIVLLLSAGPNRWSGGIVMGAYCGTAGLLGGLTLLALIALDDEPELHNVPLRATGVGLGVGALAGFETLWHMMMEPAARVAGLGLWLGLSLLVPLVLAAVGQRLSPKLQGLACRLALVSALGGQIAIHAVLMAYPGLIPPAVL